MAVTFWVQLRHLVKFSLFFRFLRSLREKCAVELTNPDWLGDQAILSEFGLRRRTNPGSVVTGGGVDTSLPSAPLLASLRAIQVSDGRDWGN